MKNKPTLTQNDRNLGTPVKSRKLQVVGGGVFFSED